MEGKLFEMKLNINHVSSNGSRNCHHINSMSANFDTTKALTKNNSKNNNNNTETITVTATKFQIDLTHAHV